MAAYIANWALDYNYMFLMSHDGTPYSIVWNMVGGSPIFYPLLVVGLFVVYIVLFYAIYEWLQKRRQQKAASAAAVETVEPATETVIEEDMAA